jgi:hypothetical protein
VFQRSPKKFQLTRLDVQFRSSVARSPDPDKLAFIWIDESQFRRHVKLFRDVMNVGRKFRVLKKI